MGNSCAQFNGTDGYITVPDDTTLQIPYDVSCSYAIWTYLPELVLDEDGNSGVSPIMLHGTNRMVFYYALEYEYFLQGFPTPITPNAWHHIVITTSYIPGNPESIPPTVGTLETMIYVDGVFSTNGMDFEALSGSGLVIGKLDTAFFAGAIDDLRIYKGKALSAEEVSIIYNGGVGKKYEASDVSGATSVIAFDFDEGTGNPVSKGSAILTGTITGGVTWQDGGVPFITSRRRIVSIDPSFMGKVIIRRQGYINN